MKRFSLLTLFSLMVVLGGCSSDPTAPDAGDGTTGGNISAADRQAIEDDMSVSTDLFEDGSYTDPGDQDLPFDDFFGGLAALTHPVADSTRNGALFHFFRRITERQRTVVIRIEQEGDVELARVSVTDKLAGTFNIVKIEHGDSLGSYDRIVIRKPLKDIGHRFAVFARRIADKENDELMAVRRGWHLAAISHRRVSSPEHTTNIRAIVLQSRSGLEVKIDDPLALRRFPHEIPGVLPGEPVRVTVHTIDPTDFVFLFTRWGRRQLKEVEPGVYVGGFHAPDGPRFFHFGVNALDHGTLADPDDPYDSDFWGILMRSAPTDVALSE